MSIRTQNGLTLVEVLVSSVILITAMAVALGAISSLAGAGRTVDRQNEMVLDSNAIFKSLSDDVALSGWAPYDCTSANFANSYTIDRSLRYYPYVVQQAPTATAASSRSAVTTHQGGGLQVVSPIWFQSLTTNWFVRPNQFVNLATFNKQLDLAPSYGVSTDFAKNFTNTTYVTPYARLEAYRKSFYARSQELILLRAAVGGWSSKPGVDTTPILKFPTGNWTSLTKDVGGGVLVKDNHTNLGVIKMSQWQLGDTNPTTAGAPDLRNPSTFYWNRSAAPAGLKQIPVAVNLGAMLSPQADPGNLVQVRWDTMTDPASTQINMAATPPHAVVEFPAAQGGNARIKAEQLREYTYLVVPSNVGSGRLVRAHTELVDKAMVLTRAPWIGDCIGKGVTATGKPISLIIDKVYTENCMRVVFETYRTVGTSGGLMPNQIRVTLYLAMGNGRPGDVPMTHITSTLLTMRVLNSSTDNESITTLLGTTAPGLAY